MVNVLAALRTYLIADSTLSALTTRVYINGLPKAQAANMPRQAVVVQMAGGLGVAGDNDSVDVIEQRVDLFNYGINALSADAIYRATHDAMKAIDRNAITVGSDSLFLHRAVRSGGAVFLRDPDGDWPVVVESWSLLAAEVAVT